MGTSYVNAGTIIPTSYIPSSNLYDGKNIKGAELMVDFIDGLKYDTENSIKIAEGKKNSSGFDLCGNFFSQTFYEKLYKTKNGRYFIVKCFPKYKKEKIFWKFYQEIRDGWKEINIITITKDEAINKYERLDEKHYGYEEAFGKQREA